MKSSTFAALTALFADPMKTYWTARLIVRLVRENRREQDPNLVPLSLNIQVKRSEDGTAIATIPQFPGLAVDGANISEALYHALDAAEAYIASLRAHGEPLPLPLDSESGQEQASVHTETIWTSRPLIGAS